MQRFFITGTDTNVGKTLVSAWFCLNTGYGYFKPIQTGYIEGTDSYFVSKIVESKIYKESYLFKEPISPHLAACHENIVIDITKIRLPKTQYLFVEGAGGLLVPINDRYCMIDLIKQLNIPAILVCHSKLGAINHTLLSLEALRYRSINVCGIIISGEKNQEICDTIEHYGQVEILGHLPFLKKINRETLKKITLSNKLKKIFELH